MGPSIHKAARCTVAVCEAVSGRTSCQHLGSPDRSRPWRRLRLQARAVGAAATARRAAGSRAFANLLVGTETGDDAAVWRLDDETCIVATTDFFMPMVDDPFDFGRIAATNALSDVYAMGGKPILALAILGMPIDKMPIAMIREILRGGAAKAAEAGIPGGGRPFDRFARADLRPRRRSASSPRRRSGATPSARPGDALILTKPLGVGIYSAAIKKGALSDDGYREMLGFMTPPQPRSAPIWRATKRSMR